MVRYEEIFYHNFKYFLEVADKRWFGARAESKIHQGVTTEIIGNCGKSVAPLKGSAKETAKETMANYGLKLDWTSLEGYLKRLEKNGTTINVASFVGQGIIREGVMGYEA